MSGLGSLATAKHFPGVGMAESDSHFRLPRITWNTVDDKERDMVPFLGAIAAGVELIMTGHFIVEPGDSMNPVSLSAYWMTDVLRKEMGFKGLTVVDNIEMKPITDMMPPARPLRHSKQVRTS